MLVLARRHNESIIIKTASGEVIEVVLIEIKNLHKVRIGIIAPADVKIKRHEIYEGRSYAGDKQAETTYEATREDIERERSGSDQASQD